MRTKLLKLPTYKEIDRIYKIFFKEIINPAIETHYNNNYLKTDITKQINTVLRGMVAAAYINGYLECKENQKSYS